ncbi:MAG: OsmC family peroxiredoxin [Candidatus Lokiarchaeota archaeon]|nr:OsmC family peroxiredoxin [Candidatus Lokiarchaeota archaeon]
MGFKETLENIKKDVKNGEKNFNVQVETQPDGSIKAMMDPFEIIIDAPPGLDGSDLGPSPLLVILASVGACICAVTKFWAKIKDIKIDEVKVFSRGHINLGGIFGVGDEKPYYDNLRPLVRIKSSEPKEKIDELMNIVWERCPIINNMNMNSGLEWKVEVKS